MLYEAHLRKGTMLSNKWPTLKKLNCIFLLFLVPGCFVWAYCLFILALNRYSLGIKG